MFCKGFTSYRHLSELLFEVMSFHLLSELPALKLSIEHGKLASVIFTKAFGDHEKEIDVLQRLFESET